MNTLRKVFKFLIVPLAFILPFLVVTVPTSFGVRGWGQLGASLYVAPILLFTLLAIAMSTLRRQDVKETGMVSKLDITLQVCIYITISLAVFFTPDSSGTGVPASSMASTVFGAGFLETSSMLSLLFVLLSILSLGAALVIAPLKHLHSGLISRT